MDKNESLLDPEDISLQPEALQPKNETGDNPSGIDKKNNVVIKAYNVLNNSFNKTYNAILTSKKKIKNTNFMKKTQWYRRFFLKLLSSNPLFKTLILYLIVIFIFAGLLLINNVQIKSFHDSNKNTFFFSFFTTLSTITATGMMLNPIPQTYSVSGQVVLFFLIEFGGIIFSYIVSSVYLSFRSNVGNKFNDQAMIQIEKGDSAINSSLSMMKWNIVVIGGMQLIFGLSLFACFYYIPGRIPEANPISSQYYVGYTKLVTSQYHNAIKAFWSGIFDSAGALSNAGMTLFGSFNAAVYRNGLGIVVQFLLGAEFILGGIGFPLFYDLIIKIKMKIRHQKYKLSLYSSLSLYAVLVVTLVTTVLAYIFAYINHSPSSLILATNYDNNHQLNTIYSPFGKNPHLNKDWCIFFSILNTHSAGYSSINLENLSYENKWNYIVSMFIGCCPSSSAGEIKLVMLISTIYFIVNKMHLFSKMKNIKSSITKAMVWNSLMILLLGVAISVAATFCFYFFYNGPVYEGHNWLFNQTIDSIFLGVSTYSMCGLVPGNIFNQNFFGELTTLIVILSAQMVLVFSIFIVQKHSYSSDELRIKRLKEDRLHAQEIKLSEFINNN